MALQQVKIPMLLSFTKVNMECSMWMALLNQLLELELKSYSVMKKIWAKRMKIQDMLVNLRIL